MSILSAIQVCLNNGSIPDDVLSVHINSTIMIHESPEITGEMWPFGTRDRTLLDQGCHYPLLFYLKVWEQMLSQMNSSKSKTTTASPAPQMMNTGTNRAQRLKATGSHCFVLSSWQNRMCSWCNIKHFPLIQIFSTPYVCRTAFMKN